MTKINDIRPLEHPYLKVLECVDDLSKKLYYYGKLPDVRLATVAIVGSRKPSAYGREVTLKFAVELARRGVVIVSGLALGVDAIAHQATLEAGGTTIAVQANGLHKIYPSSNRQLAESILRENGAILSEYETGTEARPYQFLQRNRIVSGLADVVLITEAAARSGSLNTASHALSQGKYVFAVPGNITSPMSAGCNALLAQGALPATSPDDILSILKVSDNSNYSQAPLPLGATPTEQAILEKLSEGISDGDELCTVIGCTQRELSTALTMLEIQGSIRSLGANQWSLH